MKLCAAVQEGCGYKDTHTVRASLLCSVGKIFHCVHYLSAALRISTILSLSLSLYVNITFHDCNANYILKTGPLGYDAFWVDSILPACRVEEILILLPSVW